MPKISTESVNTTIAPSQPASTSSATMPKDTATLFNPAKPTAMPAQSSTDSVQPYHHKANHNQNRSVEQSSEVVAAASAKATTATINAPVNAAPKIGFVSLGCPKA